MQTTVYRYDEFTGEEYEIELLLTLSYEPADYEGRYLRQAAYVEIDAVELVDKSLPKRWEILTEAEEMHVMKEALEVVSQKRRETNDGSGTGRSEIECVSSY